MPVAHAKALAYAHKMRGPQAVVITGNEGHLHFGEARLRGESDGPAHGFKIKGFLRLARPRAAGLHIKPGRSVSQQCSHKKSRPWCRGVLPLSPCLQYAYLTKRTVPVHPPEYGRLGRVVTRQPRAAADAGRSNHPDARWFG